jgi:hypothetical protein
VRGPALGGRFLQNVRGGRLLEEAEVAEQPPQDDEDEDGREAAAAQLLGAPTGRHAPQYLAHPMFLQFARDAGPTVKFASAVPGTEVARYRTMRTRTHPAPAATVEPIRASRKALAELVEKGWLEEAMPLARFILHEVDALDRAGFARPVRAIDLDLCTRIVGGLLPAPALRLSPVAPA